MLVFHIDLNTVALRRETISALLRFVAACGYDSILWEVEDKVRWETCPECAHPDAFTKEEFREILDEAKSLGLAPIPLLQTFGHAEYVLSHEKYRAWRELPEKKDCYCVSRADVRDFLKAWLHEYLELFGDGVKFFHLGGDEAYSFGKCPVCAVRDRMELYVEHLKAVAGELLEKGIRPGCWCDMLLAGDDEKAVAQIPADFVIWHWDYYYGCRNRPVSRWSDKTRFLQAHGYDVVFCGASQCGGEDPFLPRYEWHSQNLAASAKLVNGDGLLGLCVTSWSIRGSLKAEQYPLIDYAARCFRNPGLDAEAEFSAVCRRFFGDVTPAQLFDLTDWDHFYLAGIEGRSWNAYKDASVPMKGQFAYVLATQGRDAPNFAERRLETVAALLRRTEAAASAMRQARGKTALLDVLLQGADLRIRLFGTLLAALRGEKTPPAPYLASAAYYGLEQTDWSAFNFARIVWAVLDERYAEPFDGTQLFTPR